MVKAQIGAGDDHAFPASIDSMPTMRDTSVVRGGDGIPRMHVKLPGEINGVREPSTGSSSRRAQ
jgi:hypothetical protein